MTERRRRGLFVAEGSSDMPIADVVEALFVEFGVPVELSRPDFSRLSVAKDVRSRIDAGIQLIGEPPEVVVVHRDADNAGPAARKAEIHAAATSIDYSGEIIPIIPVRMTEAWLLVDESAIRFVAGNPTGRVRLGLPKQQEIERIADPKRFLQDVLLAAASVSGRRRKRLDSRFAQNRRQLLERLDPAGQVSSLPSWRAMRESVRAVADSWYGA